MPFEVGHPRYGGMQKGQSTKRNQEIADYASAKNVSPANALVDILSGEKTDIAGEPITKDDYKWALEVLMPYMFGKRKPVDSDGNDATDPLISFFMSLNDKR